MHDSSKRHTLKLLGGSTASVVIPSSIVMAEAATRPTRHNQFPQAAKRRPELLIQLVRSTAVSEDTVVLRNTTNGQLVISQFMPGTVIFDDVQCDLNEAAAGKELILQPGQVMSLRTQMAPIDTDSVMEYVWANASTQPISGDVSLVSLGAFMADGRAVVYPFDAPAAQTPFPA